MEKVPLANLPTHHLLFHQVNQANICFYYLRQCYKFVLIVAEVRKIIKTKLKQWKPTNSYTYKN